MCNTQHSTHTHTHANTRLHTDNTQHMVKACELSKRDLKHNKVTFGSVFDDHGQSMRATQA